MRTYTVVCDAEGCDRTEEQVPGGSLPEGWQEWRSVPAVTSPTYSRDRQLCPEHVPQLKADDQ